MNHNTFDSEKKMQPYMDAVYKSWGYTVDRSVASKLFDIKISNEGKGFSSTIEEKFNFIPVDKTYDQMIVEIMQDLVSGDLGWYYHCRANWLVWAYCPDNLKDPPLYFYFIHWQPLKEEIIAMLKARKWASMAVVTEGYGLTINIPVKFNVLIKKDICTKYDYDDFSLPFDRIEKPMPNADPRLAFMD